MMTRTVDTAGLAKKKRKRNSGEFGASAAEDELASETASLACCICPCGEAE
jgi:hypothetical protein